MAYKALIYTVEDSVATITLNRPDCYNALNRQMVEELLEAVRICGEDQAVRVVVLMGAGRAFCAGGDVRELLNQTGAIAPHVKRLLAPLHTVISCICRMSKPVIAGVGGVAAGAGMGLAMACDLAVAATSARFTMAYTKLGLPPDAGSSYFLPRLVGLRRAMELTFTNRVLTADEAEEWGLINRVVPDTEFVAAVYTLANELAAGPALAVGRAKRLFCMSDHASLETQMENEAKLIALSGQTADFCEGMRAFAEKRAPTFNPFPHIDKP
ncbi:enoyl-CoA hydratase [Candidatus Methylomirabilis lanthanidiphila]|uniref:Enoyl-CoA hydratase n=1 Tax=Candidatus Methylomirabilis lanthanidiphila TaxID=2211376 RepID=A0A564ZLJ1_9BACT|nr:enoyl-CoA hydratase/isomerase family protein [Candidatus Methylomirabilis lanthanidiphila]VUZ86210.1 enoyl-CoA hydratase [Candidatus Methylomirabilis lanthanidiphila]